MKRALLALTLSLSLASWAQTATDNAPQSKPTDTPKISCCDKMAGAKASAKDGASCPRHAKADGKEIASCCAGKDAAASCCKDAKSCAKGDKMSCCKDCGKDKTAANCCGKECGKGCCSSAKGDKTAKNCCDPQLRS